MNAVQMQLVASAMLEADAAPHSGKQAIYKHAAEQCQVSLQTFYRWRRELRTNTGRKRRNDAGCSHVTREEAKTLAGIMLQGDRQNAKRMIGLERALENARSNGLVTCGKLDKDTGELTLLSASAVAKAMKTYHFWPEQLRRPTPKIHLRSKYPNHVWQIDPSLCVLYYLPTKQGEAIQIMDEKVFYKNKPANIRRIEKERVWRYVVTDHASGTIFVHYVLGAESGKNLVDSFIEACQPKAENNPFCGLPEMVMVDPGSANTGAVFKNLARALGVHVQVCEPGHPWAKGQVEKGNDIVECHFESRFAFMRQPPTSLDEINHYARLWMTHFNAHETHRRLGVPRFEAWQRITEEQLRLPPPAETMRLLATRAPETRKVGTDLTISFRNRSYSVADVPMVMVGETVMVTQNPWREEAAQVLYAGEDGRETMQVLEPLERDDFGFFVDSATIGEEHKQHKDTTLDTNRKAVERHMMGVNSDDEATSKRKAKVAPLNGKLDPMKPLTDKTPPSWMPKRGTEHQLTLPAVEPATLTLFDAARTLSTMLGESWTPRHYQWLQQRYPEGVKEDVLPSVCDQLRGGAIALRAVNGEDA